MKAVLDTNVVVSGLISPEGHPGRIIAAWNAGQFEWISSRPLLAELTRVLAYPKVRRFLASDPEQTAAFLKSLEVALPTVDPGFELQVLADGPDNRLLEAAVASQADYLVSGDGALLGLTRYEGVEIVTPARFRAVLESLPRTG